MDVLKKVRKELKKHVDPAYRDGSRIAFKEELISFGVRANIVRRIANESFKDIQHLTKEEVFQLCEELMSTRYHEEMMVAVQWVSKFEKEYELKDFETFERWLNSYVDNWAKDDDLCTRVIRQFIFKYPAIIPSVKKWTTSKNIWVRRAAAVSFVVTSKMSEFVELYFNDMLEIASILLEDEKDLVQKGYGWMLKNASQFRQREVFEFIMRHKDTMPRTALRYAIEKMPKDLKKKAMS